MTPREKKLRAAQELIGAAYGSEGCDDQRGSAIVKHFKTGARRPWGRRIWHDVYSLRGGSNEQLANWLCTGAARVSDGLNHGSLSIENLVVMLAELRPRGWTLPELPAEKELALEGFIEAMTFLRQPGSRSEQRERPSREEVAALLALLSEKDWFKFDAQRERSRLANDELCVKEAEARLEKLAERICGAASERVKEAVHFTVDQLRELQRTWADLWVTCRNEVPFDWADKL